MVDSVQASYITGTTLQGLLLLIAILIWLLKFSGVFARIGLPSFKKWTTKISFTISIFLALASEVALYIILVIPGDTDTVIRNDGVIVVWVRWAFYIIIFTAAGYAYSGFFWFDKIDVEKRTKKGSTFLDFFVKKVGSIATAALNAITFTMLLVAALIDNPGRWAPYAIAGVAFLINFFMTGYLTFQFVPVKYTKVGAAVKFLVFLIAFVLWGAYIAVWAISDVAEQVISFAGESWIFFSLNVMHSIFLILLIFAITGPRDKFREGEKPGLLGKKKHKSVSNVKNTRSNNKKKTSPLDDLTAEDLFN